MTQYHLSQHAFVCVEAGRAVFLNVRRNRYLSLEREDTDVLVTLLRGWPAREAASKPGIHKTVPDQAAEIAAQLLEAGLLTTREDHGKPASPATLTPVTRTIDDVQDAFPRLSRRDVAHFVAAWLATTAMLKAFSLERIIRRVAARKERHQAEPFDIRMARRLMMIYFLLRPAFFSETGACLRDSLTFLEFLSRYGLYPNWVFGVRTDPFSAHSWIQHDGMVLNDFITHVRPYKPILVV